MESLKRGKSELPDSTKMLIKSAPYLQKKNLNIYIVTAPSSCAIWDEIIEQH